MCLWPGHAAVRKAVGAFGDADCGRLMTHYATGKPVCGPRGAHESCIRDLERECGMEEGTETKGRE